MGRSSEGEITQLLHSWAAGEEARLEELMPLVYGEFRAIARRQLRREPSGHSLQTSDLVNEAFLRLVDQNRIHWESRGQFFAVAAKIMRRSLVDHARRRRATKRGGDPRRVALDDLMLVVEPDVDLVLLDECLRRLETLAPRQAHVVELRFFAGCTWEEIAEALVISLATAKREWRLARVWLRAELGEGAERGS